MGNFGDSFSSSFIRSFDKTLDVPGAVNYRRKLKEKKEDREYEAKLLKEKREYDEKMRKEKRAYKKSQPSGTGENWRKKAFSIEQRLAESGLSLDDDTREELYSAGESKEPYKMLGGVMSKLADAKQGGDVKTNEDLQTTLGYARTRDDAKKIKEATELKDQFNNILGEMIALRGGREGSGWKGTGQKGLDYEKGYGSEVFNREAVGRGKQLSKQLLLKYKDMARLGVLSQADENILNQIIAKDPLAFDFVPGQDPIMTNLKGLQGDVEADFTSKIAGRLRNPSDIAAASDIKAPPTKRTANIKDYKEVEKLYTQGSINPKELTDEELDYFLGLKGQGAYGAR